MTKPTLVIEQLSFAYVDKKKALNRVSFEVNPGHCTLLLGPNGAGKSTLFSLITRLYDCHQGSISLGGFNLKQNPRPALAKLGVVFQQTTLDLDLTVMQNLRYHALLHGMGRKQAGLRIEEELQRLAMYERRFEPVRQLNGGHRRRVEIARALLHQPALLLLDEPTVGLDIPSRQAIVDHIHQLSSEHPLAVLWATHLMDEIAAQDRLVVLHHGQVKAVGQVETILTQTGTSSIAEAFNLLTQGSTL